MSEDTERTGRRPISFFVWGGMACAGVILFAVFPSDSWPNWVAQGVAAGTGWILITSLAALKFGLAKTLLANIGALLFFGVLIGAAIARTEWLGISAITAVAVCRLEWTLDMLEAESQEGLKT